MIRGESLFGDEMNTFTLLLVDGTAVAYRSFYAIRDLSTRDGVPTNAVYGFIRALDQMDKVWRPDRTCIVFDGGVPEERLALLNSYKAQRESMPDALASQLELINEFLDIAGIPHQREPGQEADDVIAALTRMALAAQGRVLIATSDKDMFQLVGPDVTIVPLKKDGVVMGAEEVRLKTGVSPEHIPDWLALVGDSADNIPGVPGVGPKTAAKWLAVYNGLSEVLENSRALKPERLGLALEACREEIVRNLALVRLNSELPLALSVDEMQSSRPDAERLMAFYERLELHSLARELKS